jgi:co-chaperonin GroES (HSP10)
MTSDNVLIRFLPDPSTTAGGLVIPQQAHGRRAVDTRKAEVMLVGPGHYRNGKRRLADTEHTVATSTFVPTEVKVGDVVLVHARAGQNYELDINVPRHNKPTDFQELGDERGEFRIIREDEVLGVVEQETEAAE